MSLTSFESQINDYANQLTSYNEEYNSYKNALIEAQAQAKDFTDNMVTETVTPIATELLRIGGEKLLGAVGGKLGGAAADIASKAIAGKTSEAIDSAINAAKDVAKPVLNNIANKAQGLADDLTGGKLQLPTADEILANPTEAAQNLVGRVQSLASDTMEQASGAARGAIDGVQETANEVANAAGNQLENVQGVLGDAENAVSSMASKIANTPEYLSNMASKLSGGVEEQLTSLRSGLYDSINSISSRLGQPGSSIEMTDFANFVPKTIMPDTQLSFGSTFENPLKSVLNLEETPEPFSGLSNMATDTLENASKFVSRMTEPLAHPGLSSNNIARAFMGEKPQVTEPPPPTQEEALELLSGQQRPVITNELVPRGAGNVVEPEAPPPTEVQTPMETPASAPEDVISASQESEMASNPMGEAQQTINTIAADTKANAAVESEIAAGAGEDAGAAGEAIAEAGGEAAAEAGTEVAAGAAGGPAGLIIGGLVAVGSLLFNIFHHTSAPHLIAPPAMPQLSVPEWQPGLATGN